MDSIDYWSPRFISILTIFTLFSDDDQFSFSLAVSTVYMVLQTPFIRILDIIIVSRRGESSTLVEKERNQPRTRHAHLHRCHHLPH